MNGFLGAAAGAVFVWLGMVLAISFLEAPLKFRAPGVTLQVGLGIGRLVFRALNACEVVLAAVAVSMMVLGRASLAPAVTVGAAVAALGLQVVVIRPALTRRSDLVLADAAVAESGRSRAHLAYVGFEVLKVVALLMGGVMLLTA